MRKASILVFCFVLSRYSWCQGYFDFSNVGPSNINAPVYNADGTRLSGTRYLASLYIGRTLDSMQAATEDLSSAVAAQPFYDLPPNVAGYFVGANVVANNVVGFSLVWAQVRAWDSTLGTSYDEALQAGVGGYGESDAFQVTAGGHTGAGRVYAPLVGLESFSLRAIVPEPNPLCFVLLAIPAFWIVKRIPKNRGLA
jgi:hypothetical protein